jgi:hypothetical protein
MSNDRARPSVSRSIAQCGVNDIVCNEPCGELLGGSLVGVNMVWE